MLRLARQVLASEYVVLLLTVLYVLCLWPVVPEIVSGATALASVVAASIMTADGGYLAASPAAVPIAILGFLAVGLTVGLLNGLCVTRFGMPAFMVTLVAQTFLSGLAIWYTSLHSTSVSIGDLPAAFTVLGRGSVFGIPYALILCVLVAAAAHWLLRRTTLGRWLYAVGSNPRAALVSGVPVHRVIVIAFVLSSLCAAIASIVYTARLETGTPVLGQRVLLDVIGAAVIGGVSLFGGRGKIAWVIFGVLFLTVIDKGLQLLGVSQFMVFAVKGGVILVAAILDALRNRFLIGGVK